MPSETGVSANAPPSPNTAAQPPSAQEIATGDGTSGAIPGAVQGSGLSPLAASATGSDAVSNYIPPPPRHGLTPAREALRAGDGLAKPDYNRGTTPAIEVQAPTAPVLARPSDTAMPILATGVTLPPASEMTAVQANSTLSTVWSRLKAWTANYPHPATGEIAHVLAFTRGLTAQQAARTDAIVHGQEVPADPIEAAKHLPPPEAFALRDLVLEARNVMAIYQRAMTTANLALTTTDQTTVTAFTTKLGSVNTNIANTGSLNPPGISPVVSVVATPAMGGSPAAGTGPVVPAPALA